MSVLDVETTSKKRCFNVASTLSSTESNWASDDYGFVYSWIVFVLLNEKIFLLII